MAIKTPRDRPYSIPPRTRRDATVDWFYEHEYAGKLVLLTLLLILPVIAMCLGLQEAWHAWLHDWRVYDDNRKDKAGHDSDD